MSRFLIEREFPDGLSISQDEGGANLCRKYIDNNAEHGVTWVHSYVTPVRVLDPYFYNSRETNR
jgi:hypothetical protein